MAHIWAIPLKLFLEMVTMVTKDPRTYSGTKPDFIASLPLLSEGNGLKPW